VSHQPNRHSARLPMGGIAAYAAKDREVLSAAKERKERVLIGRAFLGEGRFENSDGECWESLKTARKSEMVRGVASSNAHPSILKGSGPTAGRMAEGEGKDGLSASVKCRRLEEASARPYGMRSASAERKRENDAAGRRERKKGVAEPTKIKMPWQKWTTRKSRRAGRSRGTPRHTD